ncbi:hypothetical protein LY76DRAFT_163766 [Colletotrichum caudatum]|nr:hypothetical protein LY76DRAFT_163766 [Colletotrichum caudatum]
MGNPGPPSTDRGRATERSNDKEGSREKLKMHNFYLNFLRGGGGTERMRQPEETERMKEENNQDAGMLPSPMPFPVYLHGVDSLLPLLPLLPPPHAPSGPAMGSEQATEMMPDSPSSIFASEIRGPGPPCGLAIHQRSSVHTTVSTPGLFCSVCVADDGRATTLVTFKMGKEGKGKEKAKGKREPGPALAQGGDGKARPRPSPSPLLLPSAPPSV